MILDEPRRGRLDRVVAERNAGERELAVLVGDRLADRLAGRIVDDDGRAFERVEQRVFDDAGDDGIDARDGRLHHCRDGD